jgi:hypothetical protein
MRNFLGAIKFRAADRPNEKCFVEQMFLIFSALGRNGGSLHMAFAYGTCVGYEFMV